MNVIIVFDISDDIQRTKLTQELFRYAIRTQKSVFEAQVTKKELKNLKQIVNRYSNGDDKVNLYEFTDVKRFGDVLFIDNDSLIY